MAPEDALAVIPVGAGKTREATDRLVSRACEVLGSRCLVLSFPYLHSAEAWQTLASAQAEGVVSDLRDAYLGQGEDWNKEELYTALHCRGCADQLGRMLAERGLSFDASDLRAEAWGESFDGCVTKYSLNLRRLLRLRHPICIDFDAAVPDAKFLLEAELFDCAELGEDHRLFVFTAKDRLFGLFVALSDSLATPARRIRVPVDPQKVTVLSKRGGRLWPRPAEDTISWPNIGVTEPPQELVQEVDGALAVPLSTGLVFRLAKSPAYVLSDAGLPPAAFRDQLAKAVLL
jgi:hypothetical protein